VPSFVRTPAQTYLALYYVLCDFILLGQVVWYRRYRMLHPEDYPALHDDERTSLLAQESKVHLHKHDPWWKPALFFVLGLLFVFLVGIVGWQVSARAAPSGPPREVWDDTAQIIGWISAVLYRAFSLGAPAFSLIEANQ
jgi:hypothetical protein